MGYDGQDWYRGQGLERVAARYPDIQFKITDPLGPHRKLAELVLLRLDDINLS